MVFRLNYCLETTENPLWYLHQHKIVRLDLTVPAVVICKWPSTSVHIEYVNPA